MARKRDVENQGALTGNLSEVVSNGPAGAAILSAGVGSCALGILAVASDGSTTIAHWLTFYFPTGPLSGVTSMAILIWLATWAILSMRWRTRNVNLSRTNAFAILLLAAALLLTFPPFEDILLRK